MRDSDYAALKTELSLPGYGGKSSADAAAAINAKTESVPVTVPATAVRECLTGRKKWLGVLLKANAARANADTTPAAGYCQMLYDLANAEGDIAMGESDISSAMTDALAALVEASVLTAEDVAALLALATKTVSWAVRHLGSEVTDHDVDVARAL